ncbi:DUF1003 domain-containing protein [Micrococcus porci]|uniref:DUF1003 domain-containing protein n=1 Tax=Micrococcus TaxID=1269 RepID=UPI001CCEA53B|nr:MULTISPECIES: DUF1003 domain-containing protein [Micrococcus]MCG7421815.1 DUF1003 domain-containing protein [Micrococcus sp. ACRRV]UBH25794.1 DUF1003 domain-containing protein [Micrococcus porci]
MPQSPRDPRDTRATGLDTPMRARERVMPRLTPNPDAFGEWTEGIARFMGTPQFLLWMTLFCLVWVGWNSYAPEPWRFDSAALGFTALTLMLSLQASYAAPLLLLAQNRQDDRDKVALREDRDRAERNLADTEFLTREISGLRIALQDMATRDYVRGELRAMNEDLVAALREVVREEVREELRAEEAGPAVAPKPKEKSKKKSSRREPGRPDGTEAHTTTLAIIAAQEAADQGGAAPDAAHAADDAGQDAP